MAKSLCRLLILGKSCLSRDFLTSLICLLMLFAKIKFSRKCPNTQYTALRLSSDYVLQQPRAKIWPVKYILAPPPLPHLPLPNEASAAVRSVVVYFMFAVAPNECGDLCNSDTIGCPPVRGENPRALASGFSYVQVDNCGITILYHLHQCRPCTSRDISY